MNTELLTKIRALLGGLIVCMDSNDMAPSSMMFVMPLIVDIDKMIEQETGEHIAPAEYLHIAKDETVQRMMDDPDLSDEQKQKIMDVVRLSEEFMTMAKSVLLDEPDDVEVKDDDNDAFAAFLRSMEDDGKLEL